MSFYESTRHKNSKVHGANMGPMSAIWTLLSGVYPRASYCVLCYRVQRSPGNLQRLHYNDVIMRAMAFQITSLTIVNSTVYSGAHQRKEYSFASQAFVGAIHRWPVNSPHKGPVTRKMFAFDDVIMDWVLCWECNCEYNVSLINSIFAKLITWLICASLYSGCNF